MELTDDDRIISELEGSTGQVAFRQGAQPNNNLSVSLFAKTNNVREKGILLVQVPHKGLYCCFPPGSGHLLLVFWEQQTKMFNEARKETGKICETTMRGAVAQPSAPTSDNL